MKRYYFFLIFILLSAPALTEAAKTTTPSVSSPKTSIFSFKEIVFSAKDHKETFPESQFKDLVIIEPSLKTGSGLKSEAENIRYCPSDPIICKLSQDLIQNFFLKKETAISVNTEKINDFAGTLSEKFDVDPIDAKFQVGENGIADFAESKEGITINTDKAIELLKNTLAESGNSQETREISLPYDTVEPKIKASEAGKLGINKLIGEGVSNFRGSPKNRIFNINVAIQKFNGVLIAPDEEFSFIKTLGPVDGEHGYAPELVIKKDKTEPEFGGGICQVSTTAFRAAIYSGLKITVRRNHAYPVAYYNPQGMDSTVYVPWPDLRFINNTPGNILIQVKIEGTVLKFQFYGTDDGRKTEIIGPKVLEKNADGSMKTTFTQKVTNKDGDEIINDVFNSSYDSPSKYPHPGEEKLTTKPKGWSNKEWNAYKKTNGI